MQIAPVGLGVMMRRMLIVGVVPGWISDCFEICWNVRGEGFPADMLQVMGRVVPGRAVRRMLFMMAMMSVGSVDQRSCNLKDAVCVDEEERADSQRERSRDCAGRSPAPMFHVFVSRQHKKEFTNRNLAKQVA